MKKGLLLLILALISAPMFSQNAAIPLQQCLQNATQASVSGLKSTNYQQGMVPSCSVTVYLTGTTTKASIFSDVGGTVLGNPFTASISGQFLAYASISNQYDVVLSNSVQTPLPGYLSPVAFVGLGAGGGGGGSGCTNNCTITNAQTLNSALTVNNTVNGWPQTPYGWAAYGINMLNIYQTGGWDCTPGVGACPWDEAGAADIEDSMQISTPGIFNGHQIYMQANSPGDTIALIGRAYGNGTSAGQGEGQEGGHLHSGETSQVFRGTLNSNPTCGATCNVSLTQTEGYPAVNENIQFGENMNLIDLTNAYTTGYAPAWTGVSNGTQITGSGTNWNSLNSATPTSSFSTTTTDMAPNGNNAILAGTVTLASAIGFSVSATQPVCFFNVAGDIKWQCSHITNLAGNVATIDRIDYAFPAGTVVSQGGTAGWGFSYDYDSYCASPIAGCPGGTGGYGLATDQVLSNTDTIIRQVFPVIGNTSATSEVIYGFYNQSKTLQSGGTAVTNAYHMYPTVEVLKAYNSTTGKVDGGNVTTTPVGFGMTISNGDTMEQPHWFAGQGDAFNLAFQAWQQNYKNHNYNGIVQAFGGAGAGRFVNEFQGFNYNSAQVYRGLPQSEQSYYGQGTSTGTTLTATAGTFVTGSAWNGLPIEINGACCYTITSVTDSTHLVYSPSTGTIVSPVPWSLYAAGLGQLGNMGGVDFRGPHAWGLYVESPVFGDYYGQNVGTVLQGCSPYCSTWGQPITVLGAQNQNSTSQGWDVLQYNPTSFVWNLTAGATYFQGYSYAQQLTFDSNGLKLSNLQSGVGYFANVGANGLLAPQTSFGLNGGALSGSVTVTTSSGAADQLQTIDTNGGSHTTTWGTQYNGDTIVVTPSTGTQAFRINTGSADTLNISPTAGYINEFLLGGGSSFFSVWRGFISSPFPTTGGQAVHDFDAINFNPGTSVSVPEREVFSCGDSGYAITNGQSCFYLSNTGLTNGTTKYFLNNQSTIPSYLGGSMTIGASANLTLAAMSGTQCLEEVAGVVTATGSACGSGGGSGISGLTANYIPLAGSATTITANSHLDDGVTTAGTITSSEPIALGGLAHGLTIPAGTAVSPASGKMVLSSDPTVGNGLLSENGAAASRICTAANAATNTGCQGSGSGTVTNIATTGPITGGPVTTTGTIACPTCVTSAASLTSGALMTGAGSQASQTNTTGTGVLTALGNNVNTTGGFPTAQNCQAITATATATVNWASGSCAVVTANGNNVTVTLSNGVSGFPGGYTLGLCNDGTPRTWTIANTAQLSTPNYPSECFYKIYSYNGTTYEGTGSNVTPSLLYGVERTAPVTSASGAFASWWDSTTHQFTTNENAGAGTSNMVQNLASATTGQWVQYIDASGVQHLATACDTSSTTCAGGSVSEVASTSYWSPWQNASGVALTSANQISGAGFTVTTPITFSHIYLVSDIADGAGLYSAAIANSSGTLICNPSAAQAMPANATGLSFACASGSVTLYPGNVYIMLWTGNGTTGKPYGVNAGFTSAPYSNTTVTGCTSSSGLISGTCSITLSPAVLTTTPTFYLH